MHSSALLIVACCAVPSDEFTLAFKLIDKDGDGELDRVEFQSLMAAMRNKYPSGRQVRDKNVLGESLGRLEVGGLMEQLFGVHGM